MIKIQFVGIFIKKKTPTKIIPFSERSTCKAVKLTLSEENAVCYLSKSAVL